MLSSFTLNSFSLLVLLLQLTTAQAAGYSYSLQDNYEGTSFFEGFDFFTEADPTHGYVTYVDQITAQQNGLISTNSSAIYIGVDYSSILNPSGPGRQSVRLESKTIFNDGLFIGDFAHMPGGICGVWPAWWTYGANWPNSGEIDIIENANAATTNLMSLHTNSTCTIAGTDETGLLITNDCNQYSATESGTGCGVSIPNTNSYGAGFNAIGGGVYAMEWTNTSIRGWFFPRGSIPSDITAGTPEPATWGTPFSNFEGSCDMPSHFFNHKMVFDTTFCGDWAGAVFSSDSQCSALGTTCINYVASNPAAFEKAYWAINSVRVYRQGLEATSPSPLVVTTSVISTTTQFPSSSIVESTSSGSIVSTRSSIVRSTSLNSAQSSSSSTGRSISTSTTLSIGHVLSPTPPSVVTMTSTQTFYTTIGPAVDTGSTMSRAPVLPTSPLNGIPQVTTTANASFVTATNLASTVEPISPTLGPNPQVITMTNPAPPVATVTTYITYLVTDPSKPPITVFFTEDQAKASPTFSSSIAEATTTPVAQIYTVPAYTVCRILVTQIADGQIQAPNTVCSVMSTQVTPRASSVADPTWITAYTTTVVAVTNSDNDAVATVVVETTYTTLTTTTYAWMNRRSRRWQAYNERRLALPVTSTVNQADKATDNL